VQLQTSKLKVLIQSHSNQQQAEGEDELKKRQLMELAIINGTYRDSSTKAAAAGKLMLLSFMRHSSEELSHNLACEEEWRRLAASAAAETRLLSPGMQQLPNQIRTSQGTPLGKF